MCMNLALDQELAFFSLISKYKKLLRASLWVTRGPSAAGDAMQPMKHQHESRGAAPADDASEDLAGGAGPTARPGKAS